MKEEAATNEEKAAQRREPVVKGQRDRTDVLLTTQYPKLKTHQPNPDLAVLCIFSSLHMSMNP